MKLSLSALFVAATTFTTSVLAQNIIQNWGNGDTATNYTYNGTYPNGRYTVDWKMGTGGNFVVGKGYPGNRNL
jgi:endo-1,4-beta-xylanase